MNSNIKQKIHGSIMATMGFLLSPLSWWNDLYVNIPIAYGLAWLAGFITDKKYFGVWMIFFYWLSNLAGLLLIHRGMTAVFKSRNNESEPFKRSIFRDIWVSIIYTGVLAILVYTGILKYPQDYFK
ncbi:MAG: hypothetical protein A2283_17045 [Lentisphaerae bacterium RIFOXYA12_FULL_48_11]|nr:MAG: hypothetical protein A2283_17045 [Lentisphaerae bacterium RIFOXYA12_FULL_48_11]